MAKVPPPPFLTKDKESQALNRWLLELTSILNSAGQVDPGSVAGLAALVIQVGVQAGQIATLQGQVTTQAGQIAALQITVAAHTASIATLTARAQVLNGVGAPAAGLGNINDWYANIGGGIGARVYVKTGVGVWTAFPF